MSVLHACGSSFDAPDTVFMGRRRQRLSCRAHMLTDPAQGHGGLAVRLQEQHHDEIETGSAESFPAGESDRPHRSAAHRGGLAAGARRALVLGAE